MNATLDVIRSMFSRLTPLTVNLAVTLVLLSGMSPIMAQSDAEDRLMLEEVIVTAQKREQSLQDVGISVTAFSAADIARMEIRDSKELLLNVPNLDIRQNAGSSQANIFLRGIGSAGIGFNVQSGVGMYSDEVVLNSPTVNILQVYDLERVEVLRGPQNTLYGRNTTGGAVNFISNRPQVGEETNGYATGSYGRFNELNLEGAVSTPMGDKAALRVAVQSQTRDGIRTNLLTGRDDIDQDKLAGRVQLALQPSDTVSVNLKAHAERVRSGNIRFKVGGAYAPGVSNLDTAKPCATPFVLGACSNGYGFVDVASPRTISSDMVEPQDRVDASGFSAQVNVDFRDFTLTSITAYEENEGQLSSDEDASPAHLFHFWVDSEAEQFSQEFRLASTTSEDLRWIVGVYGFWEDKTGTTGPTFATPMGVMLVQSYADFDNTSYSAYVDLEYDVSDKVRLKGGFRTGTDIIEGNTIALFALQSQLPGVDISTPPFTGEPLPDFDALLAAAAQGTGARVIRVGGPTDPDAAINDTDFNEWGGEAGIEYRPTDELLVYGQWSRGYKAGVFPNAAMVISLGLGDIPLSPEIVNTYEAGIKTEFADGRARFNAAVFFNDYTDQQLNSFISGEFTVVNVDSDIYGAEAEFSWLPAEGLYIDAGFGYLNTEITATENLNWLGNELLNTPDVTARLAVRKEWALDNGAMFGIAGDGRYAGSRWFDLSNSISDGSYTVFNLQAYYEFGQEGRYQASVWGKNIFDELYYHNGFIWDNNGDGFTDWHQYYPSDPATYGISFRVNF